MKNNIEVIITLIITFLIFVTLVLFYESKIPKFYDNEKNLTIEITVTDINNNIITINNNHYFETDTKFEKDNYILTLKPNNKLIEKGNITKLLQEYEIIKIKKDFN